PALRSNPTPETASCPGVEPGPRSAKPQDPRRSPPPAAARDHHADLACPAQHPSPLLNAAYLVPDVPLRARLICASSVDISSMLRNVNVCPSIVMLESAPPAAIAASSLSM